MHIFSFGFIVCKHNHEPMKKYIFILLALIIVLPALYLWQAMSQHMPLSDRELGQINFRSAYSPATVANAKVGAAYVNLFNDTDTSDKLIGASSPEFGTVEIHSMVLDGEIMRMRNVPDGIDLPAGEMVELGPLGFHFMLKNLTAPLVEGTTYSLELNFEKSPSKKAEFKVLKRGDKPHADHM